MNGVPFTLHAFRATAVKIIGKKYRADKLKFRAEDYAENCQHHRNTIPIDGKGEGCENSMR